jgi:DNA repair exonuclease SbcCD ATPase subunit
VTTALTLFHRQDFSVLVHESAIATRDEALACASLVQTVKDSRTRDLAVEAQRELKTLLAAAETNRKALKAPVIDLGKAIDDTAKEYCGEVQREYARIDTLVCEWEEEQRNIARKIEEARQRDLAEAQRKIDEANRAAERERLRVEQQKAMEIQEANRKAAEAKNAAERKRLQEEAARKAAAEAERLKAEEAKRVEEAKRQQELLEQKRAEMGPPVTPTAAEGQSVREVMDFTVEDIHKLYLHKGQQCVDLSVKRAAVLALINAGGVREIPGLKIFPVTKNRVAANRQQKVLEV